MAYENFGTRQSKGFGCFTVTDPKPPVSFDELLTKVYDYRFLHQNNTENIDQVENLQWAFSKISEDYKLLK